MSNETGITIIAPRNLPEARELAKELSTARMLPEALQQKPADVLAIVMAGAELGLAPMQSVRALVLIKGKPTLSADAMGALVKSRRDVCSWLRLVESTDKVATYETQRTGDPSPTRLSFTIEQATRAGLNGDNWRKFPEAMLRARALSALCRAVYPDLLLGVYDPDELEQALQPPREVNAAPVHIATPPTPVVDAQVVDEAPSNVTHINGAPTQWEVRINEAQSCVALAAIGSELHHQSEAVRNAHRALYTRRHTELAAKEKAK